MRLIDIVAVIAYIVCYFLTDVAEIRAMSILGVMLYVIFAVTDKE